MTRFVNIYRPISSFSRFRIRTLPPSYKLNKRENTSSLQQFETREKHLRALLSEIFQKLLTFSEDVPLDDRFQSLNHFFH